MSLRAPVALLTDFGTRDPYVAAMRGVLSSRTSAPILDLTHEIAPFDVFEAAFFLAFCHRDYPTGTVFVAVVDPGVGTERRILAARDEGRFYLAPDNGLLDVVLSAAAEVREFTNRELELANVSRTFHGRDRFAPLAAALSEGFEFGAVGAVVPRNSIVRLSYQQPEYGDESIGTVIAVDRFGNVITDLQVGHLPALSDVRVKVGEHVIELHCATYGGAPHGEPFVIAGSRGTLELSMREASAAERLGVRVGTRVRGIS